MSLITLNEEKCTKCGMCIKECPSAVIEMGENGPEEINAKACLACGHCVAICPNEAIDNENSPLSEQVKKELNLRCNFTNIHEVPSEVKPASNI